MNNIKDRITEYLFNGGLFNPELADPSAVRDLLVDCCAALGELEADRDNLYGALYSACHEATLLAAERDRLRETLEQIVNCTPANQPNEWPHHHHYLVIARAALAGRERGQ